MISLLFALLFTFNLYSAGFTGDTLLLTKDGHTTFDAADLNTLIEYDENKLQPILALYKQSVEHVVHISFADETITCHKKQLFWCVNKNDWVCAKNLLSGDVLKTVEGQSIAVDAVAIIEQQAELYSLTVGPPHYLYVGKYGVLAHNIVPIVVGLSLQLTVSAGVIKFAGASLCFGLAAIGTCIVAHFAKNKNKKKQKMVASLQPVYNAPFPDPNDDKNKYTYQNGIYEDADYHRLCQNGRKSPRPQDGQKALDNSISVQYSPDQRVAIENDKIVTLQQTQVGKYHGYANTWEEILARGGATSNIRATLIKNGLVSKTGKILR